MSRHNEPYLNRQIFSTPPPNYSLPSSSKSWDFKSPPPSTYGKTVNDYSSSPVTNFKRKSPPSPAQSYSSEVPLPPTPSFNTTSQYPHMYVGTPSVGSVKVAHTPPSFPIASPISAAEQRTNFLANYIAMYYGKRYDGDGSPSTFPNTTVTYSATPEPYIFHTNQCLPPLPSQPPPPPPQNPPPPPQNPPPSQNLPPPPPQTSPARSPCPAPSTSQYRVPHYSPQYPHSYSKPFYNNYKRKSESEDYHKKNTKKRKKPLSQNIPMRKDWSVVDAKRALDVEKESNKRSKRQSLIIKFPDLDLNRDIVSKFHPYIDNVHFQQPSTPRFCFVTLKDSADPEKVISQLNKIPFGQGHLVAEFKKDREEDLNIGPEDIDPLTLYVGNLAQEVTKEDMVRCYPKQKRIDIGYAKKMKYTRYAFVSFKSVEDSINAFKHTHASQMYSKSLIVRFRRLHGTVGMPGEPKPQASQKNDTESPAIMSIDSSLDEKETEPDFQSTPWDIDVSQWEVDCNMVKQERPESPLSDEELDIKPPAPFRSRFMPGSVEVAFSLHKPKIIKIKSEKSDGCDEMNFEQSIIPDISHHNDNNEIIAEQSNPVIKVEKKNDEILKPTTYNILRSLNNKIEIKNKRTEQDQVEVKKEGVENNTIQSTLISPNNDEQVKQHTTIAGNLLPSREDDIQHKNTKFIHNENLTTQEKGVHFHLNTSRNSDNSQLMSQTNENYIESNITRNDHKTLQSSQRTGKTTNRNITDKNSRPPMSQTNCSDSVNQNMKKSMNENYIELNKRRNDHKSLQSSQKSDQTINRNIADKNSRPPMSQTNSVDKNMSKGHLDNKNSHQNVANKVGLEQQKIKVSSQSGRSKDCQSRERTYEVKEKVFANQNCETTSLSAQWTPHGMDEVLLYQNTDTISSFSRKQVSRENDMKTQFRLNEGNRDQLTTLTRFPVLQNGITVEDYYTKQQMLQERDPILGDENVSINKSSQWLLKNLNQLFNERSKNSTNDEHRKQLPSQSTMDVNISRNILKVGQSGHWDFQAEKESLVSLNSLQKDNFTEQVKNKFSVNKVDRIRQGITTFADSNNTMKEHMSTNESNGSGYRIQTTEKDQVVRKLEVDSKAMQKPKIPPSIRNECIINSKEVVSQLKESSSRISAHLEPQLFPTAQKISNNQQKEDFGPLLKDNQPVKDSELSDWMSAATEIKNEPMGEDHMNDGDKDDSSDDDFNFDNILSSMKNKMKKKRLN